MMKIMLGVQYVDGSGAEVTASVPDFVAFERKYDKPISAFSTDVRIEYMAFIAWHALNRTNETKLDFDGWLETLAELRIGEEEEIVPLESNQSTGS